MELEDFKEAKKLRKEAMEHLLGLDEVPVDCGYKITVYEDVDYPNYIAHVCCIVKTEKGVYKNNWKIPLRELDLARTKSLAQDVKQWVAEQFAIDLLRDSNFEEAIKSLLKTRT